jgi:hypothetical protein
MVAPIAIMHVVGIAQSLRSRSDRPEKRADNLMELVESAVLGSIWWGTRRRRRCSASAIRGSILETQKYHIRLWSRIHPRYCLSLPEPTDHTYGYYLAHVAQHGPGPPRVAYSGNVPMVSPSLARCQGHSGPEYVGISFNSGLFTRYYTYVIKASRCVFFALHTQCAEAVAIAHVELR